jgi:DNA/RNA endonuclease YhcR with UshA esterase domain
MRPVVALVIALAFAVAPSPAASEKKTITAAEAKDHIGQDVTVCGKVVTVDKFFSRTGRQYRLHIDQSAPPLFSVVVSGSSTDNPFIGADRRYADKDVCVTGHVQDYRGMVHMRLTAPSQIRIVKR